jgi:hypothetical protein
MTPPFDYDSPWKEALRLYLRSFMHLCFPKVEARIDWTRPAEFLDKELQQITREAEAGKQYVDMLIKVWLVDGSEEWILLHIEVQHRMDPDFPARLYRYNYRVFDVYGKRVATLAILADADPNWRPARYESEVLGCRVQFDFLVCKLLDLVADETRLRASCEPSAIVVLANWAVQQSARDDERRLALKWDLTRRLYGMGLEKLDILELYRLVDWLLRLPAELEARFRRQLYEFEAQQIMPYVTSIEQYGIEKGLEQGLEQGRVLNCRQNIFALLEARFGQVPSLVRERVQAETDLSRLTGWLRLAGTCARLEDFRIS